MAYDRRRVGRSGSGRVGQPTPAVPPRVVAVEAGRRARQVAPRPIAAVDVELAAIGHGGAVVDAERERADPLPAVATEVVPLDGPGRRARALLEAAHHVDVAADARRAHLGP